MAMFLVDRTIPGMTEELLKEAHRLLQEAVRRISSSTRPVRYLRCTYLPDEARCVCLFEANDQLSVREVNEAAQVPFRRIVSAVEFWAPGVTSQGTEPRPTGDRLEGEPGA